MNKVASINTAAERVEESLRELAPKPRTQEIAAPLKESRKQRALAHATMVEELEQELGEERARNAVLNEHNARLKAANDGYKIELSLAYDRVKQADMKRDEMVARAESARDAAVHERVRLETIFGTIDNLMTQARHELTQRPV